MNPISLSSKLWTMLRKTRFYGLTLRGKSHLHVQNPTKEWLRGNMNLGQGIAFGHFQLNDHLFHQNDLKQALKTPSPSSYLWGYIQSFTCLYDLTTINNNVMRKYTRLMIETWIKTHHSFAKKSWSGLAWTPWAVGLRISMWLCVYDFYASTADEDFKRLLMISLTKQLQYLKRHWMEHQHDKACSFFLLWSIRGLCAGAEHHLCDMDLFPVLKMLEHINDTEILNDGGHKSRIPLWHCRYMHDLIEIKSSLQTILHYAKNKNQKKIYQVPLDQYEYMIQKIHQTIEKMTPILRLLRHVDGNLAKFHYGQFSTDTACILQSICAPINDKTVDSILSLSGVDTIRPPQRAPMSGFERCANQSSVLLINTYPTPLSPPSTGHFSLLEQEGDEIPLNLLNFEWSVGKRQFIESADVIIQEGHGQWFSYFNEKQLRLYIKRGIKDGANHLHFDCRYMLQQRLFQWKRYLTMPTKGEELSATETFQMPFHGVIGIRFKVHPSFDIQRDGDKILIHLPLQTTRKRAMPLASHMADHFDGLHLGNTTSTPARPLKKPKTPATWQFHALGADDILTSDDAEADKTILVMKKYDAHTVYGVKWAFHQLNDGNGLK